MAFSYRPKNTKEIKSKGKSFGTQACAIFEHIEKNYNEKIVLDASTNFNKIKIPRSVSDVITITNLKKEITRSGIDLKGMTLDYGNGSGGVGGTDAVETALQENGTRLYCEHFIEKGKFPKASELKKVYPKADDNWIETFESQAKSVKQWLGTKGYNWSRDKGIMPFVEGIALKKCGVGTKDSWNPADIYCVKKTKEAAIRKKLTAIGDMKIEPRARLDLLNDYMRQLFKKKELIGISLKKLKKGKASLEETNVTKQKPLTDIKIVSNSILCNLDLDSVNEFETGELAFKLNIKGSIVNVQVRAFSGGVRESTQMDMTGSGAAAKLGKVSARESIDPFLGTVGLSRRMGSQLPKVGEFSDADIKFYLKEHTLLKNKKIAGSGINWGKTKWSDTLPKAIELEVDINRTASQLSAKLQCFQWIRILENIDKKGKLQEFLTVLYYGAKKEYASAGPFLKVS